MDSYLVKDHTTKAFSEVATVEFLGFFFGVENNMIIIATYISCSDLDASKRYLEKHNISQMNALAELIRALRYEIVLCGDFNAYTIGHVGFAGDESEFSENAPDGCS